MPTPIEINRAKTHCSKGHPLSGDNLWINKRRYRICRACQRAARKLTNSRVARRRGYTKGILAGIPAPVIEDAMRAVRASGLIAAGAGVTGIGGSDRWKAVLFFSPALRQRARRLRLAGKQEARFMVAAPAIIQVRGGAGSGAYLYERVARVVPTSLPRDLRDDAIGELVLAVLEGRIPPAEIESHARKIISATFKRDHNQWGAVSLDMPAYRDSPVPLVETISRGMWE